MAIIYNDKVVAGQGKAGIGLPLGYVGQCAFGIDETKNYQRYLNGQLIIQDQFEAFTTMLKQQVKLYPNLACTLEEWEAEAAASSLGQVGKFVIDDDSYTIKLPNIINAQGLANLSNCGVAVKTSLTGYESGTEVIQEAIQYPYFIQLAINVEEVVGTVSQTEFTNPFDLFDYKWSAQTLSNASWLLSNDQWNDGDTYTSAYEELLAQYNAGTDDAEGSIAFRLSTKGLKIALPSEEEAIDAKYTADGIAWYFILDTDNKQFKLPRGTVHTALSEKLYFYIGAASKSTNLVNVGRLEEKLAQKVDTTSSLVANERFDGQWVAKTATLSTATAVGTYTIDLSSYLPDDNYNYEVMLSCSLNCSTVGKICTLKVNSSIINFSDSQCETSSGSSLSRNSYSLTVDYTRKLTLRIGNTAAEYQLTSLWAYRRVGINK